MSRSDRDRLDDIIDAIQAIRSHVERGPLADNIVFDAVRMRLLEIGEAVKAISVDLTACEPAIPWKEIARARDNLAHHYFASELQIVQDTVDNDLSRLELAVNRVRSLLPADGDEPSEKA